MGWQFWKKSDKQAEAGGHGGEKLPKPKDVPDYVGPYLVVNLGKDSDWVWSLKGAWRKKEESKNVFLIRVFDERMTGSSGVSVKNYTSLDDHPELVLYEGWFNKESGKVQITGGTDFTVVKKAA